MIEFRNVSKTYGGGAQRTVVLRETSFHIEPAQNIALIGRNGAGKSTLLRMIAGTTPPDSGRIIRTGKFSWPLGFAGNFHANLSGAENVSFIADVYGVDYRALVEFVQEFSELGDKFFAEVRTYSSGMRARLAFGVSMGVNFDVYLVDEITAVGDARFKKKCKQFFKERLGHARLIMVSHSPATVKSYCDRAMILEGGALSPLMPVDEALKIHEENLSRPSAGRPRGAEKDADAGLARSDAS